jgi:hypothetical protein
MNVKDSLAEAPAGGHNFDKVDFKQLFDFSKISKGQASLV